MGGRTLAERLDSGESKGLSETLAGLGSRQATYGQKGPSATGVGKRVMSDAAQGLPSEISAALPGIVQKILA